MAEKESKKPVQKGKIRLAPNEAPQQAEAAAQQAMPEPETKEYKQVLETSDLFVKLLRKVIGALPYNTVLKNDAEDTLPLKNFAAVVEGQREIEVPIMNKLISFVAALPFYTVRDFMGYVEEKEKQPQLWTLKVV